MTCSFTNIEKHGLPGERIAKGPKARCSGPSGVLRTGGEAAGKTASPAKPEERAGAGRSRWEEDNTRQSKGLVGILRHQAILKSHQKERALHSKASRPWKGAFNRPETWSAMREEPKAYFTFYITFLVMQYMPMVSKTRNYEKAFSKGFPWPPVPLSSK